MALADKLVAKVEKDKTAPQTLSQQLDLMRPEIRKLAGKHTDRIIRLTLTQVRTNLQACSIRTILGAAMNAAAVGLEPGPLGHVWFLPYKNHKTGETECQFQIGVKGWIKLARNAGCTIDAKAVYENDVFEYEYGFEPTYTHKPALVNKGKLIAVYAQAILPGGGRHLEVMSIEGVEKVRKSSRAGNSGPWTDWYDQMCIKTVIKRMAKMLPLDTAFETAMAYDQTTNSMTRVENEFGTLLPAPEGFKLQEEDSTPQPVVTEVEAEVVTPEDPMFK